MAGGQRDATALRSSFPGSGSDRGAGCAATGGVASPALVAGRAVASGPVVAAGGGGGSAAIAVEPRTTSSGRKTYSEWGAPWPLISSTRARTAATAIAVTGWRMVVSGGSVKAISGESSKPTTETSCGTR